MSLSSANLPTTLWQPFSVELDASGNGSTNLGAPNLGSNWLAYAVVSECPNGQLFAISVSGVVVAHGGTQSPTFAAGSGQTVAITVTGGTANSTLQGVLQGTIQAGNSPQSPESSAGSLTQVSGGTIVVESADVTIEAGQNGVNVSTDAPPVAGPTISMPEGNTSYTDVITPPANATAVGFSVMPVTSSNLVEIQVVDDLTLQTLHTQKQESGELIGFSFTLPLTPSSIANGLEVIITIDSALSVEQAFVYTTWYLGTNSIQPVNYPSQPLYVQGQGAEVIAATDSYPASVNVDQMILGNGAESLNEKSQDAIPIDVVVQGINASGVGMVGSSGSVDQIVKGNQGSGSASIETSETPPQNSVGFSYSASAGGKEEIISGVSAQSIRIRTIFIVADYAGTMSAELQSPENTAIAATGLGSSQSAWSQDFQGYVLPAGDGLYLYTGDAAIVSGTITYDQY